MKRGYYYVLYIVVFSILLLGSFFVFSSSLWFLRGIAGSQQGVVEFGYQPSNEASKQLAAAVKSFDQKDVGISGSHYFRFLYIQDRSQEYIIGIPTFSWQLHEDKELEKNGWKVVRLGWILNASRPINGSTYYQGRQLSIVQGVQEECKAIFILHLPVSPIIIARSIPGFLSLDTAMSAYGVDEHEDIHIVIQYDGSSLKISQRKNVGVEGAIKNNIYVAIQSDVLKNISNQLMAAINENIAKDGHFTKTNPDIISAFPSSAQISFLSHENHWAIGVTNHSEIFKNNLIQFMKAEQGARHPVRRGFQLPDGTIGHEYVASSPAVGFSPIAPNSECQKSTGYDEQFFLCTIQDTIAFSTDQSDAENVLHQLQSTKDDLVVGNISNAIIKNIFPNADLQAVNFVGDAHSVDIWISSH